MEITKFNSQLFAALEQVSVHLQWALNTLSKLGRSALEKTRRLQEAGRVTDLRRLDGSLRLTEYIFVANFVPFRHLFRFRNDRECVRIKRVAA
jgi:hypothetical protein